MVFVGIDVSKDKHESFITNSDEEVLFKAFNIQNTIEGFNSLYQKIESVSKDLNKYVCHWDKTFADYFAKKRSDGKHYNVVSIDY